MLQQQEQVTCTQPAIKLLTAVLLVPKSSCCNAEMDAAVLSQKGLQQVQLTLPLNQVSLSSSAKATYQADAAVNTPK